MSSRIMISRHRQILENIRNQLALRIDERPETESFNDG